MATQALTAVCRSGAIIATVTDASEDNDRIAHIEVRPGMTERHPLGLMLRCWGHGHWCVANGNPSFFSSRPRALEAAQRWVDEGRGQ